VQAHALKGAAATVSAERLRAVAMEMELAAEAGEWIMSARSCPGRPKRSNGSRAHWRTPDGCEPTGMRLSGAPLVETGRLLRAAG
jgi:HPt (histidine-containing phosphotransfer) domain-containing protein